MTKHDHLLPHKGSIIYEMYLHTADENYVVARWCHDAGLMTDFFWNSVHALEKYMKAVLLFNGVSVKNFGHSVVELHAELLKLAGPLLPAMLTQPANLQTDYWHDMTTSKFMETLDRNGNADNRYLTYGYDQRSWYLHMLDTVVWSIRRLSVPLDSPAVSRRDGEIAPTNREVLARQPDYCPLISQPVDRIIKGPDSDARRALLNNNCAFAPKDFEHEPRRSGTSMRNPVLSNSILEPLRSDSEQRARRGYLLAEWLLASTRQHEKVRNQIKMAMRNALTKYPGIDQG